MEEKNETFHYTYSASQQEEIRAIREKYLPKSNTKMDQLRKLDASADRAGNVAGLCMGLAGVMMFGFGLACVLKWGGTLYAPGIVIGLVGMAAMGLSHTVCRYVTQRKREQIAPEVLKLTEELSQESGEE